MDKKYVSKIDEYFSRKAVSNSFLGLFNNPKAVWLIEQGLLEPFGDKSYLRVGSAVDCLLTSPDLWEDEFLLLSSNRPGGRMGEFVDNLPAGITPTSAPSDYQSAYATAGYKFSLERVIEWFWANEDAVLYYNEKWLNETDKILLSQDEFLSATTCVDIIKDNDFTRYFFYGSEEGIERIHQLPIYFKLDDYDCKALLDGVLIDHNKKTIQPFDLKTTGKGVWSFPTSYVQFGYYRQAAFYTLALNTYLNTRSSYDPDILTYKILPFKFVVVHTKKDTLQPAVIYTTTENDIQVGLHGGYLKSNNTKVKGIYELLEAYSWHTQEDKWMLPKDLYDSKGEILLNIFKPKRKNAKIS